MLSICVSSVCPLYKCFQPLPHSGDTLRLDGGPRPRARVNPAPHFPGTVKHMLVRRHALISARKRIRSAKYHDTHAAPAACQAAGLACCRHRLSLRKRAAAAHSTVKHSTQRASVVKSPRPSVRRHAAITVRSLLCPVATHVCVRPFCPVQSHDVQQKLSSRKHLPPALQYQRRAAAPGPRCTAALAGAVRARIGTGLLRRRPRLRQAHVLTCSER